MNRTKKITFAITATFALVGCGGTQAANTGDSSEVVSEESSKVSEFNDADVMFAQMMIPHHEQAIELADMALDPTSQAGDSVKALASRIKAGQDPEIEKMTNLLTSWGKSLSMDSSMDHSEMMSGMLSADDLSKMSALRGAEFDRSWMNGMIAHHDGAIEMADDVLKDGKSEEVRTLANAIVAAQDSEIKEMRQLLG